MGKCFEVALEEVHWAALHLVHLKINRNRIYTWPFLSDFIKDDYARYTRPVSFFKDIYLQIYFYAKFKIIFKHRFINKLLTIDKISYHKTWKLNLKSKIMKVSAKTNSMGIKW